MLYQQMVTFARTSCQCQTYPSRIMTEFCQKFSPQPACTWEELTTRARKPQEKKERTPTLLSRGCIRGLDRPNVWLHKPPPQGLMRLLSIGPSSRSSKTHCN